MNPTILQNGKSNQTPRTAVKRGHETFNAAMPIHGGTEKMHVLPLRACLIPCAKGVS